MLIATDNAIRQANQVVLNARQEFRRCGSGAVPDRPPEGLRASTPGFHNPPRIGWRFPQTQQQQHQMLTELLRHCDDAGKLLNENATQFEQMRDIMADPQSRIANLTLRTVEARARLEPARQTISSLQQRYKRLNLETIEANVLGAEENISLAEDSLDGARQGLKRPSEEHYPVAPAIVQAESSLPRQSACLPQWIMLTRILHTRKPACRGKRKSSPRLWQRPEFPLQPTREELHRQHESSAKCGQLGSSGTQTRRITRGGYATPLL
ncbi:MAG: hypothetical protein U1U88_002239 [Lawsonella clevelandensis]